MNIKICDVCEKDGKIVKSKYRAGFNRGIKIDVCEEHKGFTKGKTQKDVASWYFGI